MTYHSGGCKGPSSGVHCFGPFLPLPPGPSRRRPKLPWQGRHFKRATAGENERRWQDAATDLKKALAIKETAGPPVPLGLRQRELGPARESSARKPALVERA